MTSEVNIAKRLIHLKKLVPPVDVFALARGYAEVEALEFPTGLDLDGVCLNLKRRGRVKIFVNTADRNKTRVRFTLAHELGHILIPWHTGSIVDEADPAAGQSTGEYWEFEGEANRFASELLMPSDWVVGIIAAQETPLRITRLISRIAEVSYQAAVFRVLALLPKGYVYGAIDQHGLVVFGGKSPRTLAAPPYRSERIPDPQRRYGWATDRWSETRSGLTHMWWYAKAESALPVIEGNGDWRSVLDGMVERLMLGGEDAKKLKAPVNAIVASVNSTVRGAERSAEAVYHGCLQRFDRDRDSSDSVGDLVRMPDFGSFLSLKVRALTGNP